jgi:hypothetical protein
MVDLPYLLQVAWSSASFLGIRLWLKPVVAKLFIGLSITSGLNTSLDYSVIVFPRWWLSAAICGLYPE